MGGAPAAVRTGSKIRLRYFLLGRLFLTLRLFADKQVFFKITLKLNLLAIRKSDSLPLHLALGLNIGLLPFNVQA